MRDYDPTTGRYIQADPLGLVDGASVYGYARQNPGRYVDPRGEFGIPGAVAGAIVGGTAGYLSSGCWQGAISGAIFGAAVGGTGAYLTPAGAAAVGLAAGASGQIAANYSATGCGCSNEEPLPLIELVTSPQFWAISVGSAAGSGFGAAAGSRINSAVGTALFGSGPMYYREGLRNVVEGFVSEGVAGVGGAAGGYGGQILIPN